MYCEPTSSAVQWRFRNFPVKLEFKHTSIFKILSLLQKKFDFSPKEISAISAWLGVSTASTSAFSHPLWSIRPLNHWPTQQHRSCFFLLNAHSSRYRSRFSVSYCFILEPCYYVISFRFNRLLAPFLSYFIEDSLLNIHILISLVVSIRLRTLGFFVWSSRTKNSL